MPSIIGLIAGVREMLLSELEGLIPAEVGEALHNYASLVDSAFAIVEIGSYKGKSTCYLAEGARSGCGAHVWAVEPWDLPGNVTGRFGFAQESTKQAFFQQVKAMGLDDQITVIQAFGADAAENWRGPRVGLLYIDGDHSASSVRRDFEAWRRHLVPGATVVFDDLDTKRNPGVRRVFDDFKRREILEWCTKQAERLGVGTYRDHT